MDLILKSKDIFHNPCPCLLYNNINQQRCNSNLLQSSQVYANWMQSICIRLLQKLIGTQAIPVSVTWIIPFIFKSILHEHCNFNVQLQFVPILESYYCPQLRSCISCVPYVDRNARVEAPERPSCAPPVSRPVLYCGLTDGTGSAPWPWPTPTFCTKTVSK